MHFPSTITLLAGALAAAPAVVAHTWIEQMRNIGPDGSYVGEYGYPRGFKDKTAPGADLENDMNWLMPPLEQQPPFITADNLLCHGNQRKPVQTDNFPRLKSKPGTWLALRYAENGHVSNPANAPGVLDLGRREKGGSVFVFGTKEPKEDEKIAEVLRWTKDGQGGDKRGILLAVNNFDDGRCYEINQHTADRQKQHPNAPAGAAEGTTGFPLYCETNVQLPEDAEVGKPYTLYWVWQWPVQAGEGENRDPTYPKGKDQYYSTCMDVDITDEIEMQAASGNFAIMQQDGEEKAVDGYQNRKALIEDPIAGNVGPLFREDGAASTTAPSMGVPTQTTLATSFTSAPYMNATMTSASPVVTPPVDSTSLPFDNSAVTETVTETITVTAPASEATPTVTGTPSASVEPSEAAPTVTDAPSTTIEPSAAAPTGTGVPQKRAIRYGAKFRF